MAPVERCPQRLLPWQRGSLAPGEQLEAVVEPSHDLFDAENLDPRGRQLDGKRDHVGLAAYFDHGRLVLICNFDTGLGRAGSLDEEADGREFAKVMIRGGPPVR